MFRDGMLFVFLLDEFVFKLKFCKEFYFLFKYFWRNFKVRNGLNMYLYSKYSLVVCMYLFIICM